MWDSKGGWNKSDGTRRVCRGRNRVGSDEINPQRSGVNEILNDVPEGTAAIRRVPHGSMVVAVRTHIIPLWKWVWQQASFR